MAKFLLVDDHPLARAALRAMLEAEAPAAEVLEVDDPAAARAALGDEGNGVELLVLDLALARAEGFELLAEISAGLPALPVLVSSGTESVADMVRVVDAGAQGYLTKRATKAEVLEALRVVRGGAMYLPPALLRLAAEQGLALAAPPPAGPGETQPPPPLRTAAELGMTARQQEVLALLLQGLPNKLIARQLNLSVETVKDHVAAVLRALGVATRMQAVLQAGRMLKLDPDALPLRRPPLR